MNVLTMTDEQEDTLDLIIQRLEADGRDMSWTRAARAELAALDVGDPTPPPGGLLIEPTLVIPPPPVMHQGLYENPEGPFYLRQKPGRHFSVSDLRRQIARLRLWVTGLTMCFISALVVAVVKW